MLITTLHSNSVVEPFLACSDGLRRQQVGRCRTEERRLTPEIYVDHQHSFADWNIDTQWTASLLAS